MRPLDLQLFAEEKTEQPTAKKRREARRKGNVAKSRELSSAVILMGAFASLRLLFPAVGHDLQELAKVCFAGRLSIKEAGELALGCYGRSVLPLLLLTAGSALLVNFVQVGALVTTEPLSPKLSRLDPVSGFKRIFSRRSLVELLKSIVKVSAVGYVLYLTVRQEIPALLDIQLLGFRDAALYFANLITGLVFRVGIVLLGLAVVDLAYQRFEYEQSLKMSRREVRDELKETEGDPQVKAWIRRQAEQILKERMLANVETADVVVTNPTHVAVALKYEASTMNAPVVVAKGKGLLAEQLKKKAGEHEVPVVENPPLARALYSSVKVDQSIPPELYQAVAQVLAFVYRLRKRG